MTGPDSVWYRTWVVVPCSGARVGELLRLIDSIELPASRLVVVTTTADPVEVLAPAACVVLPWQGMYISKWWNAGIDAVDQLRTTDSWHVFCPGSDVVGSPDSVARLIDTQRAYGLTMVGPSWYGHATDDQPSIWRDHTVRSVTERVPGACFMLRGEDQLRCDETFRWWYTDDDLEMQARLRGGAGVVAGTGLVHEFDHELDAEQAQHAVEDRARFAIKWGREPW